MFRGRIVRANCGPAQNMESRLDEMQKFASRRDETLTFRNMRLREKRAQTEELSKTSVSSRQDCTLGFPDRVLKQEFATFQDPRHAARKRRHPLLTTKMSVSSRRNDHFQYLQHPA